MNEENAAMNLSDVMSAEPKKEMLDNEDKHSFELAKMKLTLAVSNAEKALAQNDLAKATYSNLIMQFVMKYNLSREDVITDDGEILRGAADKFKAQQQ